MTIDEAIERLKKIDDRNENFHAEYDSIVIDKLKELDPEFMEKLDEFYDKENQGRWYA